MTGKEREPTRGGSEGRSPAGPHGGQQRLDPTGLEERNAAEEGSTPPWIPCSVGQGSSYGMYRISLIHRWRHQAGSCRARHAPLSMEFSRQEYWSGLPCPPPGDLPDPGIEPGSPALQDAEDDHQLEVKWKACTKVSGTQ